MVSGKKILLVSHNMEYGGAPRVLLNVAEILLNCGNKVDVWSYEKGPFSKEFIEIGIQIEVISKFELLEKETEYKKKALTYDLVICNTVLTSDLGDLLSDVKPVLFYFHEAGVLADAIRDNVKRRNSINRADNIYTVSEYARECLKRICGKDSKIIYNGIQDEYETYGSIEKKSQSDQKIRFLMLGTIYSLKGLDIALKAYCILPEDIRLKTEFHIAGDILEYDYWEGLKKKYLSNKRIYYHGELTSQRAVYELIRQSDILVLPSRDDACPLVVLEAAMMETPVIISQNVGDSYITHSGGGWVVKTEDVKDLERAMQNIIENPKMLEEAGRKARCSYLKYATREEYEKQIHAAISEISEQFYSDKRMHSQESISARRQERLKENSEELRMLSKHFEETYKYMKHIENSKIWGFPFERLQRNKKIILYGAGKMGKDYYRQVKVTGHGEVILWVDKQYQRFQDAECPIANPEEIRRTSFDYVVIAIGNEHVKLEIYAILKQWGIEEERIIIS